MSTLLELHNRVVLDLAGSLELSSHEVVVDGAARAVGAETDIYIYPCFF